MRLEDKEIKDVKFIDYPTTKSMKLKDLLVLAGEYRYTAPSQHKVLSLVDARRRRDSCKYYAYHSGSCTEYKIMACNKCIGYKKK